MCWAGQITTKFGSFPFCIGCKEAELGQFPHQASLAMGAHFCGGSLLSAEFVATASHCRMPRFTVAVGMIDHFMGESIQALRFIGHPGYNQDLIINDYAVVEMTHSFTLNNYAKVTNILFLNLKRWLSQSRLCQRRQFDRRTDIRLWLPVTENMKWTKTDDQLHFRLDICFTVRWNMSLSLAAYPSGLTRQSTTRSFAPTIPVCPSAPGTRADRWQLKKTARLGYLVSRPGQIFFVKQKDCHKDGQMFSGRNTTTGSEQTQNFKQNTFTSCNMSHSLDFYLIFRHK